MTPILKLLSVLGVLWRFVVAVAMLPTSVRETRAEVRDTRAIVEKIKGNDLDHLGRGIAALQQGLADTRDDVKETRKGLELLATKIGEQSGALAATRKACGRRMLRIEKALR